MSLIGLASGYIMDDVRSVLISGGRIAISATIYVFSYNMLLRL